MFLDCIFLLSVAGAAGIEIVAGRNWRNLKVLLPLLALLVANVLFHVETQYYGASDFSRRLGLAAALVLIMIIGGRIVPSFTRNWLARENPGRLPIPYARFDTVCILVSVGALALWVLLPEGVVTGLLMLAAAGLNIIRLVRWAGNRALRDPLVLVLHVAYLFVPLGLLFSGLAALWPATMPAVAGVHVFGVGAIGGMTLAVMTRSTLGHTGRELRADLVTDIIYVSIVMATLLRFVAAFYPGQMLLLHASAALWMMAFFGFVLRYGPMVMRPRVQPRKPNPRPVAA